MNPELRIYMLSLCINFPVHILQIYYGCDLLLYLLHCFHPNSSNFVSCLFKIDIRKYDTA